MRCGCTPAEQKGADLLDVKWGRDDYSIPSREGSLLIMTSGLIMASTLLGGGPGIFFKKKLGRSESSNSVSNKGFRSKEVSFIANSRNSRSQD